MNYSLVKAILEDTWSISLQYYLQYEQIANSILSGVTFERDNEDPEPISQLFDLESASYVNADAENKTSEGLVAVHSITGPMIKYNASCGPRGTKTISKRILEVDKLPDVIAHVVVFDTGGGQSGSVAPLKEAFQKATKPVVAFVDGNMHSAGVFAAVHVKEIIALPGSFVGSIGTFIGLEGKPQSHTSEDGTVYRRIYATTSGKKNLEYEEALKGNDAPIQKNLLDPHDKEFMDTVKAHRPNVTDEQLEGGIFQVEKVVGSLVDSIGDLDFAIARAAELGKEHNKNNSSNNNSNSKNMSKVNFTVLAVAAGLKTLEVSEDGIFLTEAQAQAVQTVIENNQATIHDHETLEEGETVKGIRDENTSLKKTNGDLTTTNATLTTENEKLSKNTVKETGAGSATDDDPPPPVVDAEAQHYFELSKIK